MLTVWFRHKFRTFLKLLSSLNSCYITVMWRAYSELYKCPCFQKKLVAHYFYTVQYKKERDSCNHWNGQISVLIGMISWVITSLIIQAMSQGCESFSIQEGPLLQCKTKQIYLNYFCKWDRINEQKNQYGFSNQEVRESFTNVSSCKRIEVKPLASN